MVATPEYETANDSSFAREMRPMIKDLLKPNAMIYWSDMLLTTATGYVALWIYLNANFFSAPQIIGFFVAAFALYRALMFTHELSHLPSGRFKVFGVVWDMLIGVPLLTPSFLYTEHRTHHVNHSYGTKRDAEYVPIGRGSKGTLVAFVAQGLMMPVLAVIRFLFLAPLSLLHPKLRRFVWERASGLTQNNSHFRRPRPHGREKLWFGLQEAGCFFVCLAMVILLFAGVVPWSNLPKLYVLFAFATTVSFLRALGSHLYWNEGDELSYLNQMFDSTTIPGHPILTELWAPLGQRYHALHHVFPSIPYHALGIAHRRLMRELPEEAPYRKTVRASLRVALSEIWTRTSSAQNDRDQNQATLA